MTRADPDGRTPTPLIKPPGSIPALGTKRPVAAPPPLVFAPLGPVAAGSPGKGPGFALQDHQHPPQVIPAGSTAASVHRATWLHDFGGGFSGSGNLAPGQNFTVGNAAAGGSVTVSDNPSGELHTDGTYHAAVHGVYSVGVTAWVDIQDTTFGQALFGLLRDSNPIAISGAGSVRTSGILDLPLNFSGTVILAAGSLLSFQIEDSPSSVVSLFPSGIFGVGNGVQAEVSVYLLGTL